MDNLMITFRRFFKNKNTVTIIGVLLILVLLFIGYSTQIRRATDPVEVVVASTTIQPRTEITSDMVRTINMPNIAVSSNVILGRNNIVGKYSNINSVIPEGSMFYKDTVVNKDELPDSVFTKLKSGEVAYNFPVSMTTTYGNSIFPGNKIDIYMKVGDGSDEKIMVGKLIENIEVLAVKDNSGKAVFEDTSEARVPAMLIFGLDPELNALLKKASYMTSLGVELYPVPVGTSVNVEGSTQASTQQLVDYVNARSVDIPIPVNEVKDPLLPTIEEVTNGNNTNVIITYPKGCNKKYTCAYVQNNNKAKNVKSTTQTVIYNAPGTLTVTLIEEDKTVHTKTFNIPSTNSTETQTESTTGTTEG